MKFSIKVFFSKCDQIRMKLRILSHLLKKSFMGKKLHFLCSVRERLGDACSSVNKRKLRMR